MQIQIFPQQSLNCNAVLLPVHWDGLCLSDIHATGGIHTSDKNFLLTLLIFKVYKRVVWS